MPRILSLFMILFVLSTSASVLAALPAPIQQEFSAIRGVVIMKMGDEYLVDLNQTSGLKTGDILTLVEKGQPIVHPVTKKILGYIEKPAGFLKVSRVKADYSYAKPLQLEQEPKPGAEIKRFEKVPAVFLSSQQSHLATELRQGLPQLDWLTPAQKNSALLFFSLQGTLLKVEDSTGVTQKQYRYVDSTLTPISDQTISSNSGSDPFSITERAKEGGSVLNRTVNDLLNQVGIGGEDKRLEAPGIIRAQQQNNDEVWMGPALKGTPVGIAVADFDGDGQIETAVGFEKKVIITRIKQGKFTNIANIDIPTGTKLLSLDAIDLNHNNFPELYLTAVKDAKLNSQVFEYRNGGYQKIIDHQDWFFRVVSIPKQGNHLFGQHLGSAETPFDRPIEELGMEQNKLVSRATAKVPSQTNIFGFAPISNNQGQSIYATITPEDYLHIFDSDGKRLWASSEYFGGSAVGFFTVVKGKNEDLQQKTYSQQRIIPLSNGRFITAQNEGPRVFQRYRDFERSRIIALQWNGFAAQELWRTSSQQGYIADYTLGDSDNDGQEELVMIVNFVTDSLFSSGRSSVIIYELNKTATPAQN